MEENIVDRNLMHNAYYIICYFEERGKQITNLQLQKLLYFYEAVYLYYNPEETGLFIEEFYAWDFGPVSETIYKHFKKFSSFPIELDEEEKEIGENYSRENERYLEVLYNLCGSMSTYDLVALSHSKDSPWDMINRKYNNQIPHRVVLDKEQTRNWFSSLVIEKNAE